jgi:hypothetical protein
MANNVLTDRLSEPLNGTTAARVDINAGTGNLTIDRLTRGEQVLAGGTLQYFEKQGLPTRSVSSENGEAKLTLRAGDAGRPRFRFPWDACKGQYEWQIYLNPEVSSEIRAHSDGGNIKLDLAGMAVTHLSADTGGGNIDMVLPDNAADLIVAASTGGGNVTVEIGSGTKGSNTLDANSGAGNVIVHVPSGMAARIQATSGLGKVIVDPRFSETDAKTYQSPDYDGAANRIYIVAQSGAGNVSVDIR